MGRDEEAAATQTGEAGRGGAGVSGAAAVNGHYEQLRGDLVTTLDLQMQTQGISDMNWHLLPNQICFNEVSGWYICIFLSA